MTDRDAIPQDFGSPAGVKPSQAPEVWANEPGKDPERIWDEPEAPTPEPREEEVQIEEPIEAQPEDQAEEDQVEEPTTDEAEAEEDLDGMPERAQARIRQLIKERNEARAKERKVTNKRIKQQSVLEGLLEQQRQANEFTRLQQQTWLQQQQAEQEARTRAEREQQLLQLGYNPNDVAHIIAREASERVGDVNQRLARMEQQLQFQAQQAAVNNYQAALQAELDSALKNSGIESAAKSRLLRTAMALAREEQIANPRDAVAAALEPIAHLIKKQPKQIRRPQGAEAAAHRAIAASGQSAGRDKGSSTSGKRPKKTVEELERDWGRGDFDP